MKETKVTLDGVDVAYAEAGPTADEAKATVLYVHGNLGSYRWFTGAMEIPGLRTLAPDMPNFGRSQHMAPHSIGAYGSHIVRFIEEVAGGPVVLVGHSLGGAVSMAVATSRPDLVRGLVLVDSAAPEGLQTPEAYHPAIEAYRTDEAQLRAALGTVVPTLNDDAWFDRLIADARRMKGEAYVGHAVELGLADFTAAASNYTGPALVIRGGLDALITSEMAERTAKAFDAELREYADVGHSIMVEAPERFRDIVHEFVERL
jgi:pimeloyl-ACP methyl ester carboxylesterase